MRGSTKVTKRAISNDDGQQRMMENGSEIGGKSKNANMVRGINLAVFVEIFSTYLAWLWAAK